MSRSDGSAYPGFPSDADHRSVSAELHRESDELPDPGAYDQALWPLLAGVVDEPRCMCGRSTRTNDCETCQAEIRAMQRDFEYDRREAERREEWRRESPGLRAWREANFPERYSRTPEEK